MIKWSKLTKTDIKNIKKVITRVRALEYGQDNIKNIDMDISACHISENPLDFDKLLSFDDFSFVHDVYGIQKNIDRETGKLMNCFCPRCSKQ
jgi:hypothetical protein